MTIQDAIVQREDAQLLFEQLLTEKVNSLTNLMSRQDLSENQKFYLQKDADLCKASEELVNIFISQVHYLLFEYQKQLEFMQDMHRDITHYQELYINLSIEHAALKEKTGILNFSFKHG